MGCDDILPSFVDVLGAMGEKIGFVCVLVVEKAVEHVMIMPQNEIFLSLLMITRI